MNEWLDGWMTNLSFKKKETNMHACMHIIQNDNEQREREKNNIKKENQSKQTKNTINTVANKQEQQQSDVTIPK